jgi:hypothetical protein
MVKNFPPVDSGRTSRNPTVATVVTVWYIASTNPNPNPNAVYPRVPRNEHRHQQ